ncbi:holin [Clostridium magnum]|uniref:Bacteriophage holin n=1 Tax=Clostridium magnum DSM 2767 TaxID=1121326 RepID=A0A161X4I2_9CLOT|nr:holin [Clostridium magnum]KZL88806.1 bacteriophage holin [Clostridium magnum DSM 2767]SHI78063.1 Uncharacterized membrane protein [Clostridium magnum DSM 2767]
MDRFKNYGLWLSIAAFIPIFLKGIGLDIIPDNYNELVTSFLGILVLAGIINNPQTENKGYSDDKVESKSDETKEEDK